MGTDMAADIEGDGENERDTVAVLLHDDVTVSEGVDDRVVD